MAHLNLLLEPHTRARHFRKCSQPQEPITDPAISENVLKWTACHFNLLLLALKLRNVPNESFKSQKRIFRENIGSGIHLSERDSRPGEAELPCAHLAGHAVSMRLFLEQLA